MSRSPYGISETDKSHMSDLVNSNYILVHDVSSWVKELPTSFGLVNPFMAVNGVERSAIKVCALEGQGFDRFEFALVETKYLVRINDGLSQAHQLFMERNAPYICEVKSSHL